MHGHDFRSFIEYGTGLLFSLSKLYVHPTIKRERELKLKVQIAPESLLQYPRPALIQPGATVAIAQMENSAHVAREGRARRVRGASSKRMTSKPTGTKKITDPGTHMMTPAAAWSSMAEMPHKRGTVA